MAKKISTDAAAAFLSGVPFNRDNTQVTVDPNGDTYLWLFDRCIAGRSGAMLRVSNGGYRDDSAMSVTTRERLNAIPGVGVYQKRGVVYVDGREYRGGWVTVTP